MHCHVLVIYLADIYVSVTAQLAKVQIKNDVENNESVRTLTNTTTLIRKDFWKRVLINDRSKVRDNHLALQTLLSWSRLV